MNTLDELLAHIMNVIVRIKERHNALKRMLTCHVFTKIKK